MNAKEYVEQVLVTESNDEKAILARMSWRNMRLLHAMMGINTENGELQDQFKKYVFYGKELDEVNLIEEVGDLMWYVALLCSELGVGLEEVFDKNIAKLKLRYKGKFSETKAMERDLEGERKVLEVKS